ncbi:MAG: hypothetical protein WD645_03050 [Dehalococcoidia bacterium]
MSEPAMVEVIRSTCSKCGYEAAGMWDYDDFMPFPAIIPAYAALLAGGAGHSDGIAPIQICDGSMEMETRPAAARHTHSGGQSYRWHTVT